MNTEQASQLLWATTFKKPFNDNTSQEEWDFITHKKVVDKETTK